MLRGIVGGAVGDPHQSGDGRNVDDTAGALRQHDCAESLCEQKRSDQIHLKDAAIVRRREAFGGRDHADAGIVHQDIRAAPAVPDRCGEAGYHYFVGNIAKKFNHFGAMGGHRTHGIGRRAQIVERQAIPALRQQLRGALANTLRRPGYDRDTIFGHHRILIPVQFQRIGGSKSTAFR